jgi:hypothetical protein
MNRKSLYLSIITIVVILIFVPSCQKDNIPAVVDNTPFSANSVEKNAVISLTTIEFINNFAQVGFISNSLKSGDISFGSCPTIIVNYTTPPYSITLNWGTECTGSDGVKRTGKIDISLNGIMNVANNVATMKIENYVTDGKKVSGTTRITSAGPNPGNGWPRYNIFAEGKIEFANKSVISYRYEGVTLQAEGTLTPMVLADDVWRTEIHSASGVNQDGTTWTAKSTKVMIKKGDCKWYNSGTYEITPSQGDKITIDFGDGTCDNKATLTKGSVTTQITLD